MNYYNEYDPKAASWLRELIRAGEIPAGYVDERSILDISPHDLTGYTQHHFFAGIGGWSLALKIAGWPVDRPVRTGSCPCQPFSAAGKQLGTADDRHLWPVFRDLITFLEPATTFGEQVASALGREWLAGVRADMEGVGYAVGAADLCAAGARAPHIRQRLFWVANPNCSRMRGHSRAICRTEAPRRGARREDGHNPDEPLDDSTARSVADTDGGNASAERQQRGGQHGQQPENSGVGGLGDTNQPRSQGRHEHGDSTDERAVGAAGVLPAASHACRPNSGGFWSAFDLIPCTDGKARRVEPGSFPLAHGVSGRVGLLRGYGNAIVPQVAAEFIRAFEETGT